MKDQKTISVRLPQHVSEILEEEVRRRETTQSDVIRRALLLLKRMRSGVFVPLDQRHRDALLRVAEKLSIPYEHFLSDVVSSAIEEKAKKVDTVKYGMVIRYSLIALESGRFSSSLEEKSQFDTDGPDDMEAVAYGW